ncbi:hypothetical protein ACQ4LE_005652 [Meloidogyne hapla]
MGSPKFIFVTRGNEEFEVPSQFFDKFAFIKNFIDTYDDVKKVQLPPNAPKTEREQLNIIIKFLGSAAANKTIDDELMNQPGNSSMQYENIPSDSPPKGQWIKDFFDKFQRYQLFEAIESANFLGVIDFVDPLAEYIAQKITEIKSSEEMAEFLGYEREEEMREQFEKFKLENEEAHREQAEKEEKEAQKMKEEEEKRFKAEEAWSEALNEPDAENEDDDEIGLP